MYVCDYLIGWLVGWLAGPRASERRVYGSGCVVVVAGGCGGCGDQNGRDINTNRHFQMGKIGISENGAKKRNREIERNEPLVSLFVLSERLLCIRCDGYMR